MNCTSIRGIARSGDSGNNSLQKDYVRKSAKVPTNIYLHFSRPTRSNVSAKSWMNTGPSCFRKEYLPKVRPFPKVRELFQRIHDDNQTDYARQFRQKS